MGMGAVPAETSAGGPEGIGKSRSWSKTTTKNIKCLGGGTFGVDIFVPSESPPGPPACPCHPRWQEEMGGGHRAAGMGGERAGSLGGGDALRVLLQKHVGLGAVV